MNIWLAAVLIVMTVCAVLIYALHRGYALLFPSRWGTGGALPPDSDGPAPKGRKK